METREFLNSSKGPLWEQRTGSCKIAAELRQRGRPALEKADTDSGTNYPPLKCRDNNERKPCSPCFTAVKSVLNIVTNHKKSKSQSRHLSKLTV